MQHKMVPQGGKCVQTREREERIRQISVNILGGLKYRRVFSNPEINVKKPEVKNASVIDESHDAEDWDDEHQGIKNKVHRA